MAVRPDPEVGYRRAGDHLRADHTVERRVFIQASPRVVWATLHDPSATTALYPELRLGPAEPAWPAATTTRTASARLGMLRETARVESLEARPESTFRMRITASGFESEWWWRLEPVAGGTRVVHAVAFEANDRCDQENVIQQHKSGVRSLTAPVDTLVSNWAYMVMAGLAWSLKAWAALLLPESGRWPEKHRREKRTLLRMDFATFRNAVIAIPAQIIRSGRRIVYRLLSWNTWQSVVFRLLDQLARPLRV